MRRVVHTVCKFPSFGDEAVLRFFSAVIRMSALAVKFVSIFFIAKFLSPADFGAYGLLAAGVGYATYLVGADYYTFSNRELIRTADAYRGGIIKNQGAASAVAYLIALPVIAAAFALGFLPISLIFWFLALLFVEHLGQESMRLLVALGQPFVAAQVLFIRSGLWPLIVVPMLWHWQELRQLSSVLGCWVASGLLALAISAQFIRRANMGGWRNPVDWAWVRRGFQVAAIFLVGSLALRALFTIDRFWMEKSASPEVLGAYIFYMTVAGALPALLEAGLFTFEYPSMIAIYPGLNAGDRRRHVRKLLLRTMILSVAYAVMVALCLPLVFGFVGRLEYSEHVFMLGAGMAAMFMYVMGLVPHFALYSLGKDRLITVGNIVSLLAFFPVVIVLRVVLPVHDAIPAGLCVAFMVLFVWKWVGFSRSSSSISSQTAST